MKIFCTPNISPIYHTDGLYKNVGLVDRFSIDEAPVINLTERRFNLVPIVNPGECASVDWHDKKVAQLHTLEGVRVRTFDSPNLIKRYARLVGINVAPTRDSYMKLLEVKVNVSKISKWYNAVILKLDQTYLKFISIDLKSASAGGFFVGYILVQLESVKTTLYTARKIGLLFRYDSDTSTLDYNIRDHLQLQRQERLKVANRLEITESGGLTTIMPLATRRPDNKVSNFSII